MPAAVGAAGNGAPSEDEMTAALQRAGVSGALLRDLRKYFSLEQLYEGVTRQGHTAASLEAALRQREGQSSAAPTAEAGPTRKPSGRAAAQQSIPMGLWLDAFWPAAGWTLAVGLVWLLNGAGTMIAVQAGIQAVLGEWQFAGIAAIHQYAPLVLGFCIGIARGAFIWRMKPQRSKLMVGVNVVSWTLISAWLLLQPWNGTTIGCTLGIIAHLTISKTELLYWSGILTWRIIPLFISIAADVGTSVQGFMVVAYQRQWAFIIGDGNSEPLPRAIWAWRGAVKLAWNWLWLKITVKDQVIAPPVFPEWTARAIILTIIIAIVALAVERIFRLVWRDFKGVWAARPFLR